MEYFERGSLAGFGRRENLPDLSGLVGPVQDFFSLMVKTVPIPLVTQAA